MRDVRKWLDSLGYVQYADEFEANAIDWELLPELSDQDLEKIGVAALGHRKRILGAIRSLSALDAKLPKLSETVSDLVTPESPLREAERRQLTVMFCDLVGSTELSQQIDPEDLRELNRAYQDGAKVCVERYGGYVARYMGDGVLAYFGFPYAHEDDAERAVRAGLDLPGTVANVASSVALEVRVGIATGPVVVGDLIGEGASQESAVVGVTANLASRLQGLAAPGMTAICDTTYELVQGLFDCQSLGAQQLKGFTDEYNVWEVVTEKRTQSRFEALRSHHRTPFVARRSELSLLLDRWETAAVGEGQVVLLHGEPGIGKSRLTEELRTAIELPPNMVMLLQCSPHHRDSAYFPWAFGIPCGLMRPSGIGAATTWGWFPRVH